VPATPSAAAPHHRSGEDPVARDSITVLHVSDPQFGRNHRFGNLGLTPEDQSFDTLFARLADDVGVLTDDGVTPDLIVMSGDLAEWARRKEFEDSLELLTRLAKLVGLPHRRVVIVPGNHDVNWKLSESYFAERAGNEEQPIPPFWPKWKHYVWLMEEFYRGERGVTFTVEEPWTFWEMEELQLVVAGMNSTMAESHLDDAHYGWVGEAQARWFAQRLERYRARGWFRLGVVHHNVERGAVADNENLRDVDVVKRYLQPVLNALLHGHTHNAKSAWWGPSLPILSTGSAALDAKTLPAEVPNQYQAIRFWPDRMERWTRRYDPEQRRWIGDTRCSPNGDRWHVTDVVAFESVHETFGLEQHAEIADEVPGLARGRGKRTARPFVPPFVLNVFEICNLRYPDAVDLSGKRVAGHDLWYFAVSTRDGGIARRFPIGVCEGGASEAMVDAFNASVVAQYRALDPNLVCEIVYGGDRAPDELVQRAGRIGIRLSSFIEFQGIIDFRTYVRRQTAKLEKDVVYPPRLYVPQTAVYEVGRDQHETVDVCREVLARLGDPIARFVLVLGSFGAGKTFLLHELARRLPAEAPHLVPVLIELRALEKARTFDQLVAQHLAASGERLIDLAAFPYMLREGRIVLLFDGFDELATRITYDRATEHFETLLQAAAGRAKVVVTSRTQHFESDAQVKTALFERAETLPGLHLMRLQPFDQPQIIRFLENLLGDREAAERRFQLILDIQDLLGLSHNPRMLSFIANLPEEQLREAQERTGRITSAELYRLLITRWLTFEYERVQPRGAPPTLTVDERWRAVTNVALYLWPKLERTLRLSELADEIATAVDTLTERQLDLETATHLIGSGTLLVRDDAGTFAFVHQSVMEWLVANHAAERIKAGADASVLARGEMSALMADFFVDLAGPDAARAWATAALAAPGAEGDQGRAKASALLILDRMKDTSVRITELAGESLRGRDLSKRDMVGAKLAKADLTESRLEETNLTRADLTDAILTHADLTRANLTSAMLTRATASGARLLGAMLDGATLSRTVLRRAKLVGATGAAGLAECDTFGAALPDAMQADVMTAPMGAPSGVAFGRDDVLATAHRPGSVCLWDLGTGRPLRHLRLRDARAVAVSPSGALIAAGSISGAVRVWDTSTGALRGRFAADPDQIRMLAFSPDETLIATAGHNGTVGIWGAMDGRGRVLLRARRRGMHTVAFSPDGAFLACGGQYGLRIFAVEDGREVAASKTGTVVSSLVYHPDGTRLIGGRYMKKVVVWNAATAVEEGATEIARQPAALATVPNSDDLVAISSDGGIRMLRLQGRSISVISEVGVLEAARPLSTALSPDGTRAATFGKGATIRVVAPESGRELRTLQGLPTALSVLTYSADGERLIYSGSGGGVKFWNAMTGRLAAAVNAHDGDVAAVCVSADGTRMVTGGGDNAARLWRMPRAQVARVLRAHERTIGAVAISPDAKWIATGSHDHDVRLWNAATGKSVRVIRGHKATIEAVSIQNDRTVVSIADDGGMRATEGTTGKSIHAVAGSPDADVTRVVLTANGERAAIVTSHGTVRICSTRTGRTVRLIRGHEGVVGALAFDAAGARLATAGPDGVVRVWDAASGKEQRVFEGHAFYARSMAISPDGTRLACAWGDGVIQQWSLRRNTLLSTFLATPDGWVAFTPSGRYKLAGNLGGAFWYAIGLCRFEPGELDPFLPKGTLTLVPPDEALFDPGA
jgi:WD40 repeat protein/3',5'-cyclic AMP phosphodiesterase CpdA